MVPGGLGAVGLAGLCERLPRVLPRISFHEIWLRSERGVSLQYLVSSLGLHRVAYRAPRRCRTLVSAPINDRGGMGRRKRSMGRATSRGTPASLQPRGVTRNADEPQEPPITWITRTERNRAIALIQDLTDLVQRLAH